VHVPVLRDHRPRQLPPYLASYAMHVTAASIVFLIGARAASASPRAKEGGPVVGAHFSLAEVTLTVVHKSPRWS
jgi:hypothetical protein